MQRSQNPCLAGAAAVSDNFVVDVCERPDRAVFKVDDRDVPCVRAVERMDSPPAHLARCHHCRSLCLAMWMTFSCVNSWRYSTPLEPTFLTLYRPDRARLASSWKLIWI